MNKYRNKKFKEEFSKDAGDIYFGDTDKIVYVNKKIKTKKMVEITTVAYASYIKGEWITIIYYDNEPSHKVNMHVHVTDNLYDRNDVITTVGVRQRGSVHRLHTWAVEDLKTNWMNYKRAFLKRSKIKFSEI